MTSQHYLDAEMYPPFDGFPKEGIGFLKRLKKNNNREWFNKHKTDYEEFIKLPIQSLIADLRQPMAKLAPEMEVNPKRSMFRIYRDIRFSKNKAPYKTHVAASFHKRDSKEGGAGYYVHIEPGTVWVGGGIYMPGSDQLKKIRHAIADNPKEFLTIVSNDKFVKQFKTLEGEKLQRTPVGFPRDHMMGEWLKYKSFYTGVEWEEAECRTAGFTDSIIGVYKDLLPLVRFLNKAVGK